jgi:amino acid transporter
MVAIKLIVVLGVIAIGAFYVKPQNWIPFAPEGISGVLKGVSAVFFAYIGFDAISTTAEECRNPSRDMPRAIIYTLIICTVLYVLVSLVLTGMVSYKELRVGDPLAYVFTRVGVNNLSGIIAFTALIAMTGVLLVFQLGQPRILMSMSRDGLLPDIFSRIHPKFKTPSFATIVTGIFVAIPAMCLNLTVVLDLCSIGTLFAFVIVCGGILVLNGAGKGNGNGKGFQVPYLNGKYIVPLMLIATVIVNYFYNRENFDEFFVNDPFFTWEKAPMICFILISIVTGVLTYLKNFSLIPVLGLLTCMFLMTEMGHINWLRFIIWLFVGFSIYFTFGVKHSRLKEK